MIVIGHSCTACGSCILTCPERALLPAPKRPALAAGRCTGCSACIEVCPASAITETSP
ncbi:MAG: 4Fe-4S binding protein [Actinobacteria bacterium]|nr:4Fe-4S binding protein [Actinomycetota bacterium]MBW3642549.1 4Fe-4S binding protein [Actinomycetota bacterium]